MLVAWPAEDNPLVIFVARHDGTANDIYQQVLDALDIAVPADERAKPPCCDEAGRPPADPDVAFNVADAVERWSRTGRRGR